MPKCSSTEIWCKRSLEDGRTWKLFLHSGLIFSWILNFEVLGSITLCFAVSLLSFASDALKQKIITRYGFHSNYNCLNMLRTAFSLFPFFQGFLFTRWMVQGNFIRELQGGLLSAFGKETSYLSHGICQKQWIIWQLKMPFIISPHWQPIGIGKSAAAISLHRALDPCSWLRVWAVSSWVVCRCVIFLGLLQSGVKRSKWCLSL